MTHPLFSHFELGRQNADQAILRPNLPSIKSYAHTDEILQLPAPQQITQGLSSTLLSRSSQRVFSDQSIDLETLSTILYWSNADLTEDAAQARRAYPSGGAKYPIELYLFTDQHADLGSSFWHYRPDMHGLEAVTKLTTSDCTDIKRGFGYDFVAPVRTCIVMSYICERNVPKYGAFGGKLALIEAGHIAQNTYTTCAAHNIGVCALAGGDFAKMDELLYLDGYVESTFYSVAIGLLQD